MTFEELKKVNENVKRIEVKGKAYACVPARVQAFRELFPMGSIQTEILSLADGVVTMKATVYDESGTLLAIGHAQEKETSSMVNKTSYIENCETSAVGRALGMLGIGSDEQMASAEEVANAINQQGGPQNGQPKTSDGMSRQNLIAFFDEHYPEGEKRNKTLAWAGSLAKSNRTPSAFNYVATEILEQMYNALVNANGTESKS